MFDAVKVFSATTAHERSALGDRLTEWLAKNPGITIVEKKVMQSSDSRYHCLTILLFYREGGG